MLSLIIDKHLEELCELIGSCDLYEATDSAEDHLAKFVTECRSHLAMIDGMRSGLTKDGSAAPDPLVEILDIFENDKIAIMKLCQLVLELVISRRMMMNALQYMQIDKQELRDALDEAQAWAAGS